MEAFVYMWINKTNGRKYVGYHRGSQDDGYISSTLNENFWGDIKIHQFERIILFEGTRDQCLKYEQDYLKSIDISSDEWYNNARGAEIIFTQEVRDKIRNHHLGKSSGMKGKKHTEETKLRIKNAHKNIVHSDEWNKKVSNALKGKKKSEEHVKNLRKSKNGVPNVKNRDHKAYEFFNILTKETFVGTKMEFYTTYNLHPMLAYDLANGKRKIVNKQWILS